jgi:cellulose synthase/poly-beta-1,6-N-acetylglucosamine synthase-like glycosyltransferase
MLVFGIYFGFYFAVFAFLLFWVYNANWQKTVPFSGEKPAVSILIAARNEASNIIRCLQSISRLNYPQEKTEVLIGDDHSTDETAALVKQFIKDKPNFKLVSISGNLGQARGKANVLAHLTKTATSDYFFITDADMEVPPTWVETMLARLKPRTGIVTGITTVSGIGFFARMQDLDWLQTLGFIQVLADLDLPVTTMGNNMLITREAYESTGGYEHIPFSVTEDLALFKAVLQNGFGFKNIYQAEVLAETQPALSFFSFLHQRKRWLKGAMHLPLYLRVLLLLNGSFYLFLLLFFLFGDFKIGLVLLGSKWTCQSIFITGCLRQLNRKVRFKDLVLFEGYHLVNISTLAGFTLLPFKVNWKGRKY